MRVLGNEKNKSGQRKLAINWRLWRGTLKVACKHSADWPRRQQEKLLRPRIQTRYSWSRNAKLLCADFNDGFSSVPGCLIVLSEDFFISFHIANHMSESCTIIICFQYIYFTLVFLWMLFLKCLIHVLFMDKMCIHLSDAFYLWH